MATIVQLPKEHTQTATGAQQHEMMAAFDDLAAARRAVMALRAQEIEAQLITIPQGAAPVEVAWYERGDPARNTITGSLLGSIWGMLLGALFVNFLAVNPSTATTVGTILFGTMGGLAVGGMIAAVLPGQDERRAGDWSPSVPEEAQTQALVTVRSDSPERLDAAHQTLIEAHALDVYRS